MPTTAALAYPATDDDPPMRRAPLALPPGKKEPLLFPSPVQSVHAWRAQDRQEKSLGMRSDVRILEASFTCASCQIGVGASHDQQELYLWPVYQQALWLGGLDKVDDPGDPCYFDEWGRSGGKKCPHTPPCSFPPAPPKAADPPRYYALTYFLVCGECARRKQLPEWLRLVSASVWDSRPKLLRREIRAAERAAWARWCATFASELVLLVAQHVPLLLAPLVRLLFPKAEEPAAKKKVAPSQKEARKVLPFPAREEGSAEQRQQRVGFALHMLGGADTAAFTYQRVAAQA